MTTTTTQTNDRCNRKTASTTYPPFVHPSISPPPFLFLFLLFLSSSLFLFPLPFLSLSRSFFLSLSFLSFFLTIPYYTILYYTIPYTVAPHTYLVLPHGAEPRATSGGRNSRQSRLKSIADVQAGS